MTEKEQREAKGCGCEIWETIQFCGAERSPFVLFPGFPHSALIIGVSTLIIGFLALIIVILGCQLA